MDATVKKVKCIDNKGNEINLTVGKVYNVLSVERGWYRITDDTGGDYLYLPELFKIVE
ncbi:MAG: hypothetical protein ACM3S4_04825 [Burkholderiales bacterium]